MAKNHYHEVMEMPKYDAIFMFGPQGSGKGTQGKMLAERLGYFYWEMGGILREEAKKDTPFGRKIKSLIENGKLLEDDELERILNTELPEVVKHKRILFDGVPRRVGQGIYLVHFLQKNGFNNFATIHLDVPQEECVKRLLERAHHEFRTDDTPEKIKYRLEFYEQETLPVLKLLEGVGDMHHIDGVGAVEDIADRIHRALGV